MVEFYAKGGLSTAKGIVAQQKNAFRIVMQNTVHGNRVS
jgi:hypothetical protein